MPAKPAKPNAETSAPRRRKKLRKLLWLLPAVPAIALLIGWNWWPQHAAARCEARLADCSDADVAACLRDLDGCGDAAAPALVRLMQSPRASVAAGARDLLNARLGRLTKGEAPLVEAEASRWAELTEQLCAATTEGIAQPALDWTWNMLETSGRLRLAGRLPNAAHGRLTVACRTLLERTVLEPAPLPAAVAGGEPAAAAAADVAAMRPAGDAETARILAAVAQAERATADREAAAARQAAAMRPLTVTPAPTLDVPGVDQATLSQGAANAAARVNPMRGARADEQVLQASTAAAEVRLESSAAAERAPLLGAAPLQTRTAWELFADLGTANEGAARDELRRREFSDREIELGAHLTSGDPEERLHYVRLLPTMAGGASLKPWLLHLAGDADAEVRRACVGLMAGTKDAAILARLRELAFTDLDDEVRKQALRIVDPSGRGR